MTTADEESALAELARTADEVNNEMYYVRSDGAYRVPMGVMMRFKAAIARAKSEIVELQPGYDHSGNENHAVPGKK